MRMPVRVSVLLALASAFAQPAAACEPEGSAGSRAHSTVDPTTTSCVTLDHVMAGDISISGVWARAMLPGQPAGSGFLTLENKGAEPDRLVAVSSAAAGKVQLHTMQVVDDVMVMRPVESGIEIAPGERVEMKPGGMHLMFLDLEQPFAAGGFVPLTLTFEKAGPVDIELPVVKTAATEPDHADHQTH